MNARFSIIALAVSALLGSSSVQANAVFINEIHYDNASVDSGEAIEIAGPSGTDLAGWELVLYNGNGGAIYETESLSGLIPNQQNGFGTLTFPIAGIQNGAPDGIALVDGSATLVQFLSYEGEFTAVGGAAGGLMSTDIGVSESSSTPVGASLQLRGTGTDSGDFAWEALPAATFGTVNENQVFEFIQSDTGLVINEIDYDQPSFDEAEFIELMNTGSTSVELSQYALQFINGANNTTYRNLPLPAKSLASGEYFVICGDATDVVNCDFDAGVSLNFIQNGAPDALALLLGNIIVDSVSYEGDVSGFVEGSGTGLSDSNSIAYLGLSRFPNGFDTNQNNLDLSRRCITPGYANTSEDGECAAPGLLPAESVPAPTTLALLGLGIAGIGYQRRKRLAA